MYRVLVSMAALAVAAAVLAVLIPTLRPALPYCGDCAFTVRGAAFHQLADGGVIYAAGSAQKYGWIYFDGEPLRPGQFAQCDDWAYVIVLGGAVHASCRGVPNVVDFRIDTDVGTRVYMAIPLSNAAVFTGNNTADLRGQRIHLKVFDLSSFDRSKVKVCVAPSRCFTVERKGTYIDLLLAWEDCVSCDPSSSSGLYVDEVWHVYDKGGKLALVRLNSQGGFWHEVYVNGVLIWTWNKAGPKNSYYEAVLPTRIAFRSPDPASNAEILVG